MSVTMNADMSVEQVIDRIRLLGNDGLTTLELLEGYRQELDSRRAQFEQPEVVAEYMAFFVDMVGRAVAECERIAGELQTAVVPGPIESLRELARRSAAEEDRCLLFRDQCINRALPHEDVRPLLNDISITTRDQLTAFRDLGAAADRLEALGAHGASSRGQARGFDRRALLTRLFKPERPRAGRS